ncbi:MAG: DUF4169 family protein [Alphaproteobacteria bacterium]|nr:DUF4169 family protein [Alphaproteobacteria bacterium]
MGDVVNLNQYRKKRDREDARRTASTNRARFGRDKQERRETTFVFERREAQLNGSRIEPREKPVESGTEPASPRKTTPTKDDRGDS